MGDLNSKTPTVGCRSSDTNGKVLDEVLSSNLDLCVLNDNSPTYFKFKSDYSEILDLMLCSTRLANKVSHFEVLCDLKMGSDHAPVECTLSLDKSFRIQVGTLEPRFNFSKADWNKYGHALDGLIGELDLENCSDINGIHERFSKVIIDAASSSIPKFSDSYSKSYPEHIIELIKLRRAIRKNKKGKSLEKRSVLNTEYNRLTSLIKNPLKNTRKGDGLISKVNLDHTLPLPVFSGK